jgi:hypothetical protein
MRRLVGIAAAVVFGVTLLCVPSATADESTAAPRDGPRGTQVAVHWIDDECPGQLVAYLAQNQDRPRLEVGHAPFQAPDDIFVIPEVPPGTYQILFKCPGDVGLGGFRFGVTAASPDFTG